MNFFRFLVAEFCHKLTAEFVNKNQTSRGIILMKKAVHMFRNSPTQLTSVHSDLYQLCLCSNNLTPALEFLDSDITEIMRESNGAFDAKYYLQCYYYGGMIYAALKRFERALYFFEVAVTTPSSALSQILLESYKRYLFISLLVHGKVVPLPKYTSVIVNRHVRPLVTPYTDLATAFEEGSQDRLRALLTQHQQSFVQDGTFGLAKQLVTVEIQK